MIIILSQKIDTESEYSDSVYESYHYPARYKNQIHEGDTFIYYQGNRYVREQRYYFGVGQIGKIRTFDEENYYADLLYTKKFSKKIPIYLPDGRYVEELGYDTVRKSPTPPWQSSIRPLSQSAYSYIIKNAGALIDYGGNESIDTLKDQLKEAVRAFYRNNDDNAIVDIVNIGKTIMERLNQSESQLISSDEHAFHESLNQTSEEAKRFMEYCRTTKITYSYKMLMILAHLKEADKAGNLQIDRAVQYFRDYYDHRRAQGKTVEKGKCIYLNPDITDEQIQNNIVSNPVKALVSGGFYTYDTKKKMLTMQAETWGVIGANEKKTIRGICLQRLKAYYESVEITNE